MLPVRSISYICQKIICISSKARCLKNIGQSSKFEAIYIYYTHIHVKKTIQRMSCLHTFIFPPSSAFQDHTLRLLMSTVATQLNPTTSLKFPVNFERKPNNEWWMLTTPPAPIAPKHFIDCLQLMVRRRLTNYWQL